MTTYNPLQKHVPKSFEPLHVTLQSRSWDTPHFDQSQLLIGDFSHVDLFSHDPGQRSVPYALQAKPTMDATNEAHEQKTDPIATEAGNRGKILQRKLLINNRKIDNIDNEKELDIKLEQDEEKGGEIYRYLQQIATEEIPDEEAIRLKINNFSDWNKAWSTIKDKILEEDSLAKLLLKKTFSKEEDQLGFLKEISNHPQARLKKILHFQENGELPKGQQATLLKPEFLEELAKASEPIKTYLELVKKKQDEISSMNKDAYKKYDISTKYILENYPPKAHTYVGLGASVMPITAMLEEAGNKVYDIPLSSVRNYASNQEGLNDKENFERLSAYLDTCLSNIDLKNPILVYDYSSGNSLYVMEYILEKYFQEKFKEAPKIIPLSIGADTGKWTGNPLVKSTNITGMKAMDQKIAAEIGEFLEKFGTKDLLYRTTAKIYLSEVLSGTEKILYIIDAMPRVKRHIQELKKQDNI